MNNDRAWAAWFRPQGVLLPDQGRQTRPLIGYLLALLSTIPYWILFCFFTVCAYLIFVFLPHTFSGLKFAIKIVFLMNLGATFSPCSVLYIPITLNTVLPEVIWALFVDWQEFEGWSYQHRWGACCQEGGQLPQWPAPGKNMKFH